MKVLGISAFYHDSAAALVVDGQIVAAAQEERFSRLKHDARFPHSALQTCLEIGATRLAELDYVVFYEKPFLKFERLLETYTQFAPSGFASFRRAIPLWIREKLFQKDSLLKALRQHGRLPAEQLLFSEHHLSHAASAYYPSPFEKAAVLTMDGVGEWATATVARGLGNELKIEREIRFPHSLGLLYSAFTTYCGFRVNSGEYKLMGLAPYGEPRFASLIEEHLIDIKADGSFALNLRYFNYPVGLTMTHRRLHQLFGGPPRQPEAELTQRHMDLAASIQAVVEKVVLRMGQDLRRRTGLKNLCLAGGVALNCVANGKLRRAGIFDDIWVQPAAGDAGGAVGAALMAFHGLSGRPRVPQRPDGMNNALLGNGFEQDAIEARLLAAGARFEVLDESQLLDTVASLLASEKVVGWFQGKMEFGPRALGNRSILADPRSPAMQRNLNLKIKFRESFRPFAPAVLAEQAGHWFADSGASPYMLMVSPVHPDQRRRNSSTAVGLARLKDQRSTIPAVTHVDDSARVQTVSQSQHPLFHALVERFSQRTGCPVLVNTSFNIRGEPIVASPDDAFRCFMGTGMDVLAIGRCLLYKEAQDTSLATDYQARFAPD